MIIIHGIKKVTLRRVLAFENDNYPRDANVCEENKEEEGQEGHQEVAAN
jgi:hypothetical protein